MKNLFYILIFMLSILPAFSQEAPYSSKFGYIETSGYSKREVTPNRIYIYIRIDEKKNDTGDGFKEWEDKMIKSLEGLGINTQKQLFTQEVGSEVETYWIKKNKTFVSKEYELVLHRQERISKVFLAFQELKVSAAYIKRVDHSDIEEIKLKNKIEALTQAKKKAERLLAAVGHTLGKLLYVYDYQNQESPYAYGMMDAAPRRSMLKLGSSPSPDMPQETKFKKIEIRSNISVKFEIK